MEGQGNDYNVGERSPLSVAVNWSCDMIMKFAIYLHIFLLRHLYRVDFDRRAGKLFFEKCNRKLTCNYENRK